MRVLIYKGNSVSDIDVQSVIAQMRVMTSKAQGLALENTASSTQTGFAELLKQSIDSVSQTQKNAGALTESFVQGAPDVNLAQVMIAVQKSSVSFEALMQVRNKMVDAYKEIMRIQV